MYLFADAIGMIRDIRALGGFIGTWGGLLNIPQVLGGVIFVWTIEGVMILVTVILTLMVAGQIHRRARFSRIIGICHLPWLVLLPWIVWRMLTVEHPLLMSLWLGYVAVTIAISLVFDVWDITQYLRGKRTFDWAK